MKLPRRSTWTAAALGLLASAALAADAPVASGAWARATPPGLDTAAVYLTLEGGSRADRLQGASTARADMAHLHSVTQASGVAQMRPVDGIDVPARGKVVLGPQGLHLMLMGLPRPLVAGEHFPLTLHFQAAGDVIVDVEVRAATAGPPAAQH